MNKGKVLFIIIIPAVIIVSYLIFNVVDLLKYRGGRPEEIIYVNSIESNINYKVYLKPNDFFEEQYITNDFSFISSLVEYIKTSFSYNYVGNNNVAINYDYYIKATMISKYIEENISGISKPIWTKDFVLLNHQTGYSANSLISINPDLNVGIDYYNGLLETFRQTLNIPLESRLDISLIISIKGQLSETKTIDKEHYITLSVPLGVKVFNVDVSKNFNDKEVIYSKEQKKVEASYMLAIIYIVLVILVISAVYYFIKLIINKHKNEYEAKISKYLKEYDDRIVNVSNFIRYENLEIVNIPTFEELLTFSDETLEPIIYWEKKDKNNCEAWFSIVRDRVLYRFVLPCKK